MSRPTLARAAAGLLMLFGVLGFAPAAHAQQGVGQEPTVATVGCVTWAITTGDYTCPLTREANGDPAQGDLLFYEHLAVFDAVDKIYETWPQFEYEGYIGSEQSNINYSTGVATAFLYVYNSQWGVYNVIRSKRFYPELCDWCAEPPGHTDSTSNLGMGTYIP